MRHEVVWEQQGADNNYAELGAGEFYLNNTAIGFIGKRYDNDEQIIMEVPIIKQPTIVLKNYEAIDLTIDAVVNRFSFREAKYSCKYNIAVEELHRKIKGLPLD